MQLAKPNSHTIIKTGKSLQFFISSEDREKADKLIKSTDEPKLYFDGLCLRRKDNQLRLIAIVDGQPGFAAAPVGTTTFGATYEITELQSKLLSPIVNAFITLALTDKRSLFICNTFQLKGFTGQFYFKNFLMHRVYGALPKTVNISRAEVSDGWEFTAT